MLLTAPRFFHFINRDSLRQKIEAAVEKKLVVVDLRQLCYVDCSALMTLQEIHKQWNKEKTRVFFLTSSDLLESKLKAYGDTSVQVCKSIDAVQQAA